MICKHLQLTFRNLRRNLVFGILVLLGLVLGITTFLSSLQWSLWHLSFDRDFKDSHRIYRLTLEESREGFYRHSARVLHGDLVRDLVSSDSIPGVEKVGRLSPFRKAAFRVGEITFYEEHAYACDASILDIFRARVLPCSPLPSPGSILVRRIPREGRSNCFTSSRSIPSTIPYGR